MIQHLARSRTFFVVRFWDINKRSLIINDSISLFPSLIRSNLIGYLPKGILDSILSNVVRGLRRPFGKSWFYYPPYHPVLHPCPSTPVFPCCSSGDVRRTWTVEWTTTRWLKVTVKRLFPPFAGKVKGYFTRVSTHVPTQLFVRDFHRHFHHYYCYTPDKSIRR